MNRKSKSKQVMYKDRIVKYCTTKNVILLTACTLMLSFTYLSCQTATFQTIQTRYPVHLCESVNEICEKRLPQAILVGSPKSGTSALLRFMSYHPQIAACLNPQEPRYFDKKYPNYSLEWYRNLMPCSTSHQVTIEKSPTYFKGNTSALRIKQMNHKIKILIILKDPVEVSISMYALWKALNISIVFGKTFEDMVTITDKNNRMRINPNASFVRSATYIQHIQTWIRLFGKEQVLVVDGTVFERDPAKELHKVEKFLGIGRFYNRSQFVFSSKKNKFCFSTDPSTYECLPPNKGRAHPYVSDELKMMLRDYFHPYNLNLSKLFNRSFAWL